MVTFLRDNIPSYINHAQRKNGNTYIHKDRQISKTFTYRFIAQCINIIVIKNNYLYYKLLVITTILACVQTYLQTNRNIYRISLSRCFSFSFSFSLIHIPSPFSSPFPPFTFPSFSIVPLTLIPRLTISPLLHSYLSHIPILSLSFPLPSLFTSFSSISSIQNKGLCVYI